MNAWVLCLLIFEITYSTTLCLTVVPKRPNPPETFTSNVSSPVNADIYNIHI